MPHFILVRVPYLADPWELFLSCQCLLSDKLRPSENCWLIANLLLIGSGRFRKNQLKTWFWIQSQMARLLSARQSAHLEMNESWPVYEAARELFWRKQQRILRPIVVPSGLKIYTTAWDLVWRSKNFAKEILSLRFRINWNQLLQLCLRLTAKAPSRTRRKSLYGRVRT